VDEVRRVTFVCVNDNVPVETVGLLHAACADRGVPFRELDAATFGFDPSSRCQPGDLLYRPAVSARAAKVELFVHGPGVATFHSRDPYFVPTSPVELFERAGLPIPRTVTASRMSREELRSTVDLLGGLPVIVKVGGYEGGVGVIVADTWRGLFSTLDYLWATGVFAALSAFVPDAVHWRVVVVGDRAVAAYRNLPDEDDFRTHASGAPADYTAEPEPRLTELAVGAARALRCELVGADILEHPSGRHYLLEANFPCYFAQAQLVAGIDVAGPMVDHLMGKAAHPNYDADGS
jgi:ribosomal protein S6--L-glutamate ligase